jgi:SsrA-binding protein
MTNVRENNSSIAINRRARFDYQIIETYEAGMILTGTEVKSLRIGQAQIHQAYATFENDTIVLLGLHIDEYMQAGKHLQHDPRRPRLLLLNKKQIKKIKEGLTREGMTLVPMKMYFNARGRIKIEIGLAKGKRQVEKREATKERDWDRDKARILREKNKG